MVVVFRIRNKGNRLLGMFYMFKYSNKLLPQTLTYFCELTRYMNIAHEGLENLMYLHVELDCANSLLTIKTHYFTMLLVQSSDIRGASTLSLFKKKL
jgi:hypothetical protein